MTVKECMVMRLSTTSETLPVSRKQQMEIKAWEKETEIAKGGLWKSTYIPINQSNKNLQRWQKALVLMPSFEVHSAIEIKKIT